MKIYPLFFITYLYISHKNKGKKDIIRKDKERKVITIYVDYNIGKKLQFLFQ